MKTEKLRAAIVILNLTKLLTDIKNQILTLNNYTKVIYPAQVKNIFR